MLYNRQPRKLARFAPSLVAAEKDRVKRFFNGLRSIMQKDLPTSDFSTCAELLDKALKLEKLYNQLHTYHKQGEKKRPHQENHQQGQKSYGIYNKKWWNHNQKPQEKYTRKCPHCGRDHEAKDCRQFSGDCFKCGEMGHRATNCRKGMMLPPNNQGQDWRQPLVPPQQTQGRVFALTNEKASNAHDIVKGSRKAPM